MSSAKANSSVRSGRDAGLKARSARRVKLELTRVSGEERRARSEERKLHKKLALITVPLVLVLLAVTSYLALAVAPTEQTMGDVQRIFYYHVPSGWVAGLCFFINFVASIWYLWKRSPGGDALAAASAEVGVVFCTVLLITGPLWARPVWGIWWTWDARLTTTLVLWLIYVSYLVLRRFAAGEQTQVLAAAFAVFGFADVPIVYMSIRWFRTQHPSPVMGGGGKNRDWPRRCSTSS